MSQDEYTPPPSPLRAEEQQPALDSPPRGTLAVLFASSIIFILLLLYFVSGLFVPAGSVS